MILGLDVSTSCTGWCILNNDGMMLDMGYVSLAKLSGIFEKAKAVEDELCKLYVKYDISSVFIEENLQAFRPGLSSAKTLLTLARFNGVISYISFMTFEYEPTYINVNTARKKLGIKLIRKKNGGKNTKDQIVDWVDSELDSYSWPTKILKSGKRKGQEVLEIGCYDMADAYVIAHAGLELNN